MTKQTINIGTPDKGDGDPLRTAFTKVNANFTELYEALGLDIGGLNLGAFEFTGSTITTTDSSSITIDQAVVMTSELEVGGDIVPNVANQHTLGTPDRPFKSLYVSNNTIYIGATAISVDDLGNLNVGGQAIADVGTAAWGNITGKPTFATVATSGNYTDLSDAPVIPADISDLTDTLGLLTHVSLTGYATELFVTSQGYITSVSLLTNGSKQLSLNEQGDLELPSKFPVQFTAVFNEAHYNGGGTFQGDGTVSFNLGLAVQGADFAWQGDDPVFDTDHGYVGVQEFAYTEADHGITGYTLTIQMALSGGVEGYALNLGVSPAPGVADLAKIRSTDELMVRAGNKGWLFDVQGDIYLPPNGTIRDATGSSLLNTNPFDQDLNTSDMVSFSGVTTTFVASETDTIIWTDAGNTDKQWTFDADGNLTLNSTTAYGGIDRGIVWEWGLGNPSLGFPEGEGSNSYIKQTDSGLEIHPNQPGPMGNGDLIITTGDISPGGISYTWRFLGNGVLEGPVEGMVEVSGIVNIGSNLSLSTSHTAPSWPTIANITKQAEATVLFDDVINEDVPGSGAIEFGGITTWTTLNGVKYYYNIISPSEISLFTDEGLTTALDTSGLSGTFIPQTENITTWRQYAPNGGASNIYVDSATYPNVVNIPIGASVTSDNFAGTETVVDIYDGGGGIYQIYLSGDSGTGRHWPNVDYTGVWYTEGSPSGIVISVVDGSDIIIAPTTGQGTTAQPGIVSILAPITLANGAILRDSSTDSIAFGSGAGATSQGHSAVALGEGAGNNTQGNQAIAVGRGSGNANQGVGAIGIGFCAGATSQGDYAVAIGFKAARGNMDNDGTPNQPANSIMINASNTPLNGDQAGLYINPVREDTANTTKSVYYNTDTKELTYSGSTTTRYVMINVDGGVFGSTDGVVWDGPADSELTGISRVAVGPNMVVYIAESGTKGYELYYAATFDTAATAITSAESNANWVQVRWFDSLNKFVAVGMTDDYPTVRLSSDGITWTTLQLDAEWANTATGGYVAAGERFTDVAYNGTGYLFTTNSTVLGSFYITDMDAAIAAGLIAGNISGTAWLDDGNEFGDLLWSGAGVFTGWFAFGAGSTGAESDAWWYNNSTDPAGSAFELFDISDASQAFVNDIGYEPIVSEITIGDYNGISTVVIATENGQILWWPAVPDGPFVSIPKPYTNTDIAISNASPAVLTVNSGNGPVNNEKIIISNAGSFDGTYYYSSSGGGLYTDITLTTPFDSTSAEAWTTGTMTLSHGQYIDALNYANGKFYVGNDDEEVFVSENGGETWTLVASLNPGGNVGPAGTDYMNDVDGYIGSGIQTDRLTNGSASLTLGSNGAVSIPGKVIMTTNYPVDGAVGNPTPLDLNKSVQVLSGANADGFYALYDGVEGQIMYFTWSTNGVFVVVDNARVKNSSTSAVEVRTNYSWQVDYDSANQEPRTMAMAIFVNGAWNLMGGATD